MFQVKRNDTAPSLAVELQAGGTAVDLTGATVVFHMADDSTLALKVDGGACTVSSTTVTYDWAAVDTDTVGKYRCEFKVTFADTTIRTFPNHGYFYVEVTEDVAEEA